MRNGEVLRGKITRAGNLYYVALPDGEIRIRPDQVEFSCESLDGAYRRKRKVLHVGNVHEHLDLAQWCLRHDLVGMAARELADATAAEPKHPLIPLLQRRLEMKRKPLSEGGLPSDTGKQEESPSMEELDRLVRTMPAGSVETFSRTIQPLLINHCTASGCHGPHCKTEFRLLRVRPGAPPRRRMTQRNLHATLEWIDRKHPEESPLLTIPIRPHGETAEIFTNRHMDQYRQMVDWVAGLAEPEPSDSSKPATAELRHQPPVQAMLPGVAPSIMSEEGNATAGQTEDDEIPDPSDPASLEPSPERSERGTSVQRGQPPKHFTPADPFDPEIFNRQSILRSSRNVRE